MKEQSIKVAVAAAKGGTSQAQAGGASSHASYRFV